MDWNNSFTYIGITGMLLVLAGFWRTSVGKWNNKSFIYELDMIIGASLLILYQIHFKAYVALPINIVLVFVSFRGLSSYAESYAHSVKRAKHKKHNS